MRQLFAVLVILVAVVLSMLVLTNAGTAQAGPASPNRLLASTPTPTPPAVNKLPPSGVLPPTPTAASAPNKLPPSGGDRTDNSTLLLIGLGGLLFTAGLVIRKRRHSIV